MFIRCKACLSQVLNESGARVLLALMRACSLDIFSQISEQTYAAKEIKETIPPVVSFPFSLVACLGDENGVQFSVQNVTCDV